MINIIICEDDLEMSQKVFKLVNSFMKKRKIKYEIINFNDDLDAVIEFSKENKTKNNVYILDIELGEEKNGIQGANNIRRNDPLGEIIFLTSHTTMVMYTFKYKLKVLDFIDKLDNIKEKLHKCLEYCCENFSFSNTTDDVFRQKIGSKEYIIRYDDIISFQMAGRNHKVKISTVNSEFEFYGSLKEVEAKLDDRFHKTHRACIVNRDHIKMINKDPDDLYVLMRNDEKNLLSRNGLKDLLKE
ncbi:MAG: LytTR family DNA-binding domain-containing protein [Peptostreptococcaceae bacterium]|jgi:two-component system response regulator AgrA|nr:LytTR family DNA-binding domain-containing protein [Peptostreptococcaceae bacterium]